MKKVPVILVMAVVASLMGIRIAAHKRKMDGTLAALQEYTSVVPVRVTVVRRTNETERSTADGVLRPIVEVSVCSETDGRVVRVSADAGDRVEAGNVLAAVDTMIAAEQYARAKTVFEDAKRNRERSRILVGIDGVTRQQYEAAEQACEDAQVTLTMAREQLAHKTIRSPFRGTIASRTVEPGSTLLPSMQLFTIVREDSMVLTVALAAGELAGIRPGARAEIEFEALPGEMFSGTVSSVDILPDLSGRYPAQLSVDNGSGVLRAGMNGTATFSGSLTDSLLVLPRRCIVGSMHDASVFTVTAETAYRRAVTVRLLGDTVVAVLGGVNAGDTVVASGQMNLGNGTRIRVVDNR